MITTAQGFKYTEPADAITDFPAQDQTNWKLVEARTPRRVTAAQMSALTGIVDGQEIELEIDAAAGIYWRFRYRSGSSHANKWEFVGGPWLMAEISTQENTNANPFVDLTTVGPAVTVPRAGQYMIEHGCQAINASGSTHAPGYATAKLGAAAPTVDQTLRVDAAAASGGVDAVTASRKIGARNLLAADVVKQQYGSTGGTTYAFFQRWLAVLPIRVS